MRLGRKLLVCSILLLPLLYTLPAHALVITFNTVPSVGNPVVTVLTTDGYTFTSGHFHTVDSPGICVFGGCVDNGTIYISEEAGSLGLPITMARSDGTPFTLNGIDGAEVFIDSAAAIAGGFPNAFTLDLEGSLSGGGTLSISFALDGLKDGAGGIPDFQTFLLPPTWTGLASVTFSGTFLPGTAGGISLDNMVVDEVVPVSEPSSLLLLGFGLFGLGMMLRNRKLELSTA